MNSPGLLATCSLQTHRTLTVPSAQDQYKVDTLMNGAQTELIPVSRGGGYRYIYCVHQALEDYAEKDLFKESETTG